MQRIAIAAAVLLAPVLALPGAQRAAAAETLVVCTEASPDAMNANLSTANTSFDVTEQIDRPPAPQAGRTHPRRRGGVSVRFPDVDGGYRDTAPAWTGPECWPLHMARGLQRGAHGDRVRTWRQYSRHRIALWLP